LPNLPRSVLYDTPIAKYDVVVSAIPRPTTHEAIAITKRFVFPVSLKPDRQPRFRAIQSE
jgi:hypothetical protein